MNDITEAEARFIKSLFSVQVGERANHLRQCLKMVEDVAHRLRELRKQQAVGSALATALLTEETLLLMALVHAEKAGVRRQENQAEPEAS